MFELLGVGPWRRGCVRGDKVFRARQGMVSRADKKGYDEAWVSAQGGGWGRAGSEEGKADIIRVEWAAQPLDCLFYI